MHKNCGGLILDYKRTQSHKSTVMMQISLSLTQKNTSTRHVAPSPSQAIDLARPCITWKEQSTQNFTFSDWALLKNKLCLHLKEVGIKDDKKEFQAFLQAFFLEMNGSRGVTTSFTRKRNGCYAYAPPAYY